MNGIGGKTIAEAKENMTYREALEWAQYRKQTGPLNLALRVELAAAIICQQLWMTIRRAEEVRLYPFMPFWKIDKRMDEESEGESGEYASLNEVFGGLMAAAVMGNAKLAKGKK